MGRVGTKYRAHAMNHTCSAEYSNALITHTGELASRAQVLVRACKAIARGSRALPTTDQRTRFDSLTTVVVAAMSVVWARAYNHPCGGFHCAIRQRFLQTFIVAGLTKCYYFSNIETMK